MRGTPRRSPIGATFHDFYGSNFLYLLGPKKVRRTSSYEARYDRASPKTGEELSAPYQARSWRAIARRAMLCRRLYRMVLGIAR